MDGRLSGHGKLARAGWHGAVPGWLGAPELSGSAPCSLAAAPLPQPGPLRRAYALRRSMHVFDAYRAEEADAASALRSVHPEDQEIDMHMVVLPRDGAECQVLTWADGMLRFSSFAGQSSSPRPCGRCD